MYSNKTKDELIALCKERKIKGYSGKKKDDIIEMLSGGPVIATASPVQSVSKSKGNVDKLETVFKLFSYSADYLKNQKVLHSAPHNASKVLNFCIQKLVTV